MRIGDAGRRGVTPMSHRSESAGGFADRALRIPVRPHRVVVGAPPPSGSARTERASIFNVPEPVPGWDAEGDEHTMTGEDL